MAFPAKRIVSPWASVSAMWSRVPMAHCGCSRMERAAACCGSRRKNKRSDIVADGSIFVGATREGQREELNLKRANRHGLIAGATGTGKTVTLQGIAEGFSRAGVPVFVADVKGDLSGLAMAGS